MHNKSRRKIKILLVSPGLFGGGAERILIEIIKNIDRKKFAVELALFEKSGELLDEIPEWLETHTLNESRHYRVLGLFRIIWKLFRLIRIAQPDIVFSIINVASFPAIIASKLARRPVMAYEVSHPIKDIKEEFSNPWAAYILLKITYPMADVLLALSEDIRKLLILQLRIRPERTAISYTPFDIEYIRQRALETVPHTWFGEAIPVVVGLGTLVERKGFSTLLRAASELFADMPVRVMILGDGPELKNLKRLAEELGISGNVIFPGFDSNPWKYLSRASVFVLSSLHEGFGNVVVEAMICGVPVVSTDCPVGPSEILGNGEYGLLVPVGDHVAMAKAIKKLIINKKLSRELASKAIERAMDFRKETVMEKLQKVIFQVASRDALG